jgi:succinyl-CoA synthetase alpha subunit
MVQVAPAAVVEAEAGLRVTERVAPDCESVKVRLSMVRVAVRAATELLAAAVQDRLLPLVVTISQGGAPETVQAV